MDTGRIISLNISKEKGTQKEPVDKIIIDSRGIKGDAHAGAWHRQISILSSEKINEFSSKMNKKIESGNFAENITTSGIDLSDISIFDKFFIGDVELEVTQIGKECHGNGCAIFKEVGKCVMPKEGIFCRVLAEGEIKKGDTIRHEKQAVKILVITSSDRASAGEYEDKSGPLATELIKIFFSHKHLNIKVENVVLPDDFYKLQNEITSAINENFSMIFITGGTGIGPKDVTPEVLDSIIEKKLDGVMDYIRNKYAEKYPNSLVSRSAAGVSKNTLIYSMPGSPKAVKEYMDEILKTVEHSIFMLKGINFH